MARLIRRTPSAFCPIRSWAYSTVREEHRLHPGAKATASTPGSAIPHSAVAVMRAFLSHASPSLSLQCQAVPVSRIPIVFHLPARTSRRRPAGTVHVARQFPSDHGRLRRRGCQFHSGHSDLDPGVSHQLSIVLDTGACSKKLRQTPRCQKTHGKPSPTSGSGHSVSESVSLPVLQRIHSARNQPLDPPRH